MGIGSRRRRHRVICALAKTRVAGRLEHAHMCQLNSGMGIKFIVGRILKYRYARTLRISTMGARQSKVTADEITSSVESPHASFEALVNIFLSDSCLFESIGQCFQVLSRSAAMPQQTLRHADLSQIR